MHYKHSLIFWGIAGHAFLRLRSLIIWQSYAYIKSVMTIIYINIYILVWHRYKQSARAGLLSAFAMQRRRRSKYTYIRPRSILKYNRADYSSRRFRCLPAWEIDLYDHSAIASPGSRRHGQNLIISASSCWCIDTRRHIGEAQGGDLLLSMVAASKLNKSSRHV